MNKVLNNSTGAFTTHTLTTLKHSERLFLLVYALWKFLQTRTQNRIRYRLVGARFLISASVFSPFRLWGIAHALRFRLFFMNGCSYLEVESTEYKVKRTCKAIIKELPLNIRLIFPKNEGWPMKI